MIDDFISLGKIVSTHGLKGFVKVAHSGGILSESSKIPHFYISTGKDDPPQLISIAEWSPGPRYALVRFQNIDAIEKAEPLIGKILYLPQSQFPKPKEGEFYTHQILGLKPKEKDVVHETFQVVSILENPAHPIFVFSDGKTEILVPFVDRYIGKINSKDSTIEVFDWQDWFLEI